MAKKTSSFLVRLTPTQKSKIANMAKKHNKSMNQFILDASLAYNVMDYNTYLLNIVGTNLYKIGKSKNIKTRVLQIASGMPFDIERYLHDKFVDYKCKIGKQKEWFELTEEALDSLLSEFLSESQI